MANYLSLAAAHRKGSSRLFSTFLQRIVRMPEKFKKKSKNSQ